MQNGRGGENYKENNDHRTQQEKVGGKRRINKEAQMLLYTVASLLPAYLSVFLLKIPQTDALSSSRQPHKDSLCVI